MRIRDLGPLVVDLGDRSIDLGATKAASLLARLALTPDLAVSADKLAAAAWGVDAVVSASSLDSQLWRLRNVMEPDRAGSSSVLVRSGSGYRLALEPDQVDSARFVRLAARISAAATDASSDSPLDMIEEALALWRGDPCQPITDHPDVVPVARQLTELRQQLDERRIEVLMSLGQVDRALADLGPLIAATPYRERLWSLRIRGLAASGRTEEALTAYQQVRDLLRGELGLDPGPELTELQALVLTGALAARPSPSELGPSALGRPDRASHQTGDESSGGARARVHLPRRATPLIGRARDLDRISTLITQQRLVSLVGTGGCGKTRLAVEIGATVAAHFADGVRFVDLSPVTDPAVVVDLVVSALGLGASPQSDPAAVLTDYLADKRLLVILDNCEHVLDGAARCVELIMEAGPAPVVLVTSREPLDVDGEMVWSLSPLSVLPAGGEDGGQAPAVQLFVDRARAVAADLQFDEPELTVVERICQAVDGLPLAIELAAARVRMFSVAEIAEQVSSDPSRLNRLGHRQPDHRRTVFDAIEWSYRLLGPPDQMLHRRLSVLAGEFPLAAAREVAGVEAEHGSIDIESRLAALVHSSMLVARRSTNRATVFAQLDTVRAHARRRLAESGEQEALLARRDAWVTGLLGERPRLGRAEEAPWLDRVHEAYPVIRACLHAHNRPDGDPQLVRHGSDLAFFWYYRGRLVEGARWLQAVQEGGPAPSRPADGAIRSMRLAALNFLRTRPDLAERPLRVALAGWTGVADEDLVDVAEALVALAGAAWTCDAYPLIQQLSERIRPLAARADDAHLDLLSAMVGHIGEIPAVPLEQSKAAAAAIFQQAEAIGNLFAQYMAALLACGVATIEQDPVAGLLWTKRVVPVYLLLGHEGGSVFLEALGNFAAMQGNYMEAVRLYTGAKQLARAAGSLWPNRPQTPALEEQTRAALAPDALATAVSAGRALTLADVVAEWASADKESPLTA